MKDPLASHVHTFLQNQRRDKHQFYRYQLKGSFPYRNLMSFFEVSPNAFQSQLMRVLWAEHIPSTAIDCVGNAGTSMAEQIEQHSNNTAVAKSAMCCFPICIFHQGIGFGWSMLPFGISVIQTKSLDDSFNQSSLLHFQ
jgi:hypothetical protein